jgi:hypothetical protein
MLYDENKRLLDHVGRLEIIKPMRIRTPDGKVVVWHCPDDLIPETVIGTPMEGPPP